MEETPQSQEFNLRDYWQILVRRRWLILSCLTVTTVTALVASLLATPTYRSTTTLAIERQGVRILRETLSSSEPSWLDYQNWYNTQYQIMASDGVLRTAIRKLDLANAGMPGSGDSEPNAILQAIGDVQARVMRLISRTQVPLEEDDPDAPYLALLRGGMLVTPIRDSHLVEISFVHPDRVFASKVANALAESYIEFSLSEKLEIAEQSERFFLDQLGQLREEINAAELDLHEYAVRNQIVTGDANEVTLQDLSDARTKRMAAEIQLEETRARWETLTRTAANSIDEVRENPTIQQLQTDLNRLDREYKEKRTVAGDSMPAVKQIKDQLESVRERLVSETERVATQIRESARADYERARREAEGLNRIYSNTEERVSLLQRAFVEYQQKRAEIDRKKATLQDLLERLSNMKLSASLASEDRAHNIRTVEEAHPARGIYKPNKRMNVALGFLFGLFLGVGAAFLMEYVDNTLKTPDDVRNILRVPLLGMIPAQESLARESGRRERARTRKAGEIFDPGLVSARTPLSPIAEAYRELRTAVLLATPGHPPRDLTVTSCQPGEGKTTTAINLATTLAQLGRRVLVVDTDLRRPRCHQVLRASTARGVSTYLTGMSDITTLIQPTAIERVSLIPAGPIPPNPAELLDAPRFIELVHALRSREDFDHVIYDSPPVLSVVDPLLIGRHTEGTILVIRSAYTTRDAGRLGLEKLRSGRIAHMLGVVLNAVQIDQVPYQYRYYRSGYKQDETPASGSRAAKEAEKRAAAGGGGPLSA